MTTGLYGYYDTKKQYVVYIGKDGNIGNDARHKAHTTPSRYDKQVINRVIQKNPDRYTYFRFIEGNYDKKTLNKLEEDAIRIFKTYKYDYPERNVFNFTRGGDGGGSEGQHHPNWRDKNYKTVKAGMYKGEQLYGIQGRYGKFIKRSTNKKVLKKLTNKLNDKKITEEEVKNLRLYYTKEQDNLIWIGGEYIIAKYGIQREKQRYAILSRNGKPIKYSFNKEKLEELGNKLNNKEITEEEVKNIQLCDRKELAKNASQSNIKYNIWDVSYCHYDKGHMFKHNDGSKPRRCFLYKYKSRIMPIGAFKDFTSCEIINSIVKEAVKNEK